MALCLVSNEINAVPPEWIYGSCLHKLFPYESRLEKDVWWTLKYFKVLFKTVAPSFMLFQFILHAEEGKNSEKNDVGSCIK